MRTALAAAAVALTACTSHHHAADLTANASQVSLPAVGAGEESPPTTPASGQGQVDEGGSPTPSAPSPSTTTTTIAAGVGVIESGTIPTGDIWWRLALCESGGDPTTNTGNGYFGAFQFSLSTWRGIGETGYPTDYSYEDQRAAAQRLQARSGWSPWPACARNLGLI